MKNKALYIVEFSLLILVVVIIVLYKTEVISGEINKETKDEILMSSGEETISHIFSYNERDLSTNPYYYFNGTEYILINTTILPINYNGYDYRVNNSHQAYFKSHLSYGDAIQYCKDGYCFTIQPTKVTYRNAYLSNDDIYSSINVNSIGYANESTFIWENVFGNYNLTYDYTINSIKEELIIDKPRTPASYLGDINNITLDFDTYIKYPVGVDLYYNDSIITNNIVVDGEIEFRNSSGHVLYYLPEPYVINSTGSSIKAKYQIIFNGKYNSRKVREIYFYVQVPFTWINSNSNDSIIKIDPTVSFSSGKVYSVSVTAMDTNKVAIGWCDDNIKDVLFSTYYTNGTVIADTIPVDTYVYVCSYAQVSVTALTNDKLLIAYIDEADDDATFYVYYINGTAIVGPIDVDTDVGDPYPTISTTALTENTFIIAWGDDNDNEISFAKYYSNGTKISGPTAVADTTDISGKFSVSVSALTSDKFVLGWWQETSHHTHVVVYYVNGTVATADIDLGDTGRGSWSVSVSALTSNTYVVGWSDYANYDTTFAVYYSNGTIISGPIDVDTDVGFDSGSVSTSRLTDTTFAISWHDGTDGDMTFSVYWANGTLKHGPIDSYTSVAYGIKYQSIFSSALVSDISFCNENLVYAFANSTTVGSWVSYYSNGAIWDGECPVVSMSCASYNAVTNEYYVPTGCQCYCDTSLGPILDITKCSCIEI